MQKTKTHHGILEHVYSCIPLHGMHPLPRSLPIELDVAPHGGNHLRVEIACHNFAGFLNLQAVANGSEAGGCQALKDVQSFDLRGHWRLSRPPSQLHSILVVKTDAVIEQPPCCAFC